MKEKRPQRNDFGVAIAVVVLIVAVAAAWVLARGKTPQAGQAAVTMPATPVPEPMTPAPTQTPAPQSSSPLALPPPQSARGGVATTAAAPPPAPEPTPAELASIPRTPTSELAQKIGAVTVIDVRDADSYIAGHVAGAMHIPLQYLPGEVPWLPKDKPIVTYCT